MPLSIRGLGIAVPPHQVNQAEAMALAERVSADSASRAAICARWWASCARTSSVPMQSPVAFWPNSAMSWRPTRR